MLRSTLNIAATAQQVVSAALLTQAIGPIPHSVHDGPSLQGLKVPQPHLSAAFAAGLVVGAGSFATRLRARWAPLSGAPLEGQQPIPGLVLQRRPAADENIEPLLAVTEDQRFRNMGLYHHFEDFLPVGFSITGPPSGQNCFAAALGVHGKLGVEPFQILRRQSHEGQVTDDFQKGDVVVYYAGVVEPIPAHAGVLVDSESVRSRFGPGSPEITHPLRSPTVLRLYTGYFGFFCVFRKNLESGEVKKGVLG